MRIGVAQLNATVGDLDGNLALAIDAYEQLVGQGVDLVVYPELFLCGYPPRDLLLKSRFGPDLAERLDTFAAQTGPTPAVIGYAEKSSKGTGRPYFNAAAWCVNGEIAHLARKRLLPTYDVFDEARYFEPGDAILIVVLNGQKVAVTICEDIWNVEGGLYDSNPLDDLGEVDLLLNLSASPWHQGKQALRRELLGKVAVKCACPVAYVNLVGGNDELIFDGGSMAVAANGTSLAILPGFWENIRVIDFKENPDSITEADENEAENLRKALVLGLRDYAGKSGFTKGLIGLSGGIDSAVTCALAAEALGAGNVIGISLPSSISSQHSKDDASTLAANLGIEYSTLAIQGIVDAATSELQPLFGDLPADVTEENLQARARGLLLMAVSNKLGALLLTTGNKSELAVGYCTLYGDMCGGLAVISDVPKTQVFALARHLNRDREIIPESTLTKPPSAELSPDQKDSDSLPDYEVLDAILERYVEGGQSTAEIVEAGFGEAVVADVVRKVDRNEYKRKQAAPGLKTTALAFGVGRRIPIVQKYVG